MTLDPRCSLTSCLTPQELVVALGECIMSQLPTMGSGFRTSSFRLCITAKRSVVPVAERGCPVD
jgi:hypothetical protein